LCEAFSASRITVRQAVRVLQEEMLVRSHQGRGSFVSPCPTRRIPLINTDFCGSALAHAPDMEVRLEHWGWIAAPVEVAEQLQVFSGDRVLFARRTAILEPDVIGYDELHLVESHASLLSKDDLAWSLFVERWRQVESLAISHATQTIEAVAAQRPITDLLPIEPGSPVLKATEVFFLSDGQPAGAMVMYLRHDLFRLNCVVQLGNAGSVKGAGAKGPGKAAGSGPIRIASKRRQSKRGATV
jgi:GntR family transcriptional regulator